MAQIKTPKHITKKKKALNKGVPDWKDEYLCLWSYKLKPVREEYLDKIGQEFLTWCREARAQPAEERDRFSLERFLEDKGIPLNTMDNWRKQNKKLAAAVLGGKLMLGNMIEEGLLKKRYSERGSMFVLHNYIDRYDKDNKYHQELKNLKEAVSLLLGATFDLPELEGKK